MADEDDTEQEICEGRLDGVFSGFRNHDNIFKILGGGAWRQDEYLFQYHHLYSPRARIIKTIDKKNEKEQMETFYIEVEGVKTRVKVKPSYV